MTRDDSMCAERLGCSAALLIATATFIFGTLQLSSEYGLHETVVRVATRKVANS